MIRGIYTAASGMLARDGEINVISNNLANVNTTGFKRDETVFREFPKYLQHRLNDEMMITEQGLIDFQPPVGKLGTGTTVDAIFTQFKQGELFQTDNSCDVALWGDGYFAVQTPNGERYTRNGNFSLNNDGELVTLQGFKVLDTNNQPVKLNLSDFTISSDGTIYKKNYSANEIIDKLKIVKFKENQGLRKEGDNLYTTSEYCGNPEPAIDVQVKQGYVEKANVNVVKEMVLMIEVQRAYELNQRVIRNYDELASKVMSDVGRL